MTTSTSVGFPVATLRFLRRLAKNNDRAWFRANRALYDSDVLEPALAFTAAMAPWMEKISSEFEVSPRRSGGSVMRPHRDARFLREDTPPLKTNLGIQFPHCAGPGVAPTFYVHVEPQRSYLSVGMRRPDAATLRAIRQRIVAEPATWARIVRAKALRESFAWTDDVLKRPPRGFDPEHPRIADLRRREFVVVCRLAAREIEGPGFAALVGSRFRAGAGLVKFLCGAVGVGF